MGRIEDDELRELFKVESLEHIQALESGILRLETNPADAAVFEEVFREAHSLKGSSRMVGVKDVELISHRIEDILGSIRKGTISISSGLIDRVCRVLDSVKKLVNEAVTGEPCGVDVSEVIRLLDEGQISAGSPSLQAGDKIPPSSPLTKGGDAAPPSSPAGDKIPPGSPLTKGGDAASPSSATGDKIPPSPPFSKGGDVAPSSLAAGDKILSSPHFLKGGDKIPLGTRLPKGGDKVGTEAVHGKEYRIDTVRVDTARLDELVTLTGELSVFRTRLRNWLKGIDEAIEAIAKISKEIEKCASSGVGASALKAHGPSVSERLKGLGQIHLKLKESAYEDTSRFDFIAAGLEDGIKQLRLLPFSTLFNFFPRAVRDMAREAGKEVLLQIEGGETGADKQIIEEMKDPLMHILRNAVVHGIEEPVVREALGKPRSGALTLKAARTEANIVVEVSDDGRGLDVEEIKKTALKRKLCTQEAMAAMSTADIRALIFASGFSTAAFITETSGRGVGLDVVRTNIERLNGTVEVESGTGAGCRFKVRLPVTLATAKMLIVEEMSRRYAIPMENVYMSVRLKLADIFTIEGREAINHEGVCISIVKLSNILELANEYKGLTEAAKKDEVIRCVIISSGENRLGVLVDELLDEQEVVLKPSSGVLKRVRNVTGTTILGSGEVCMILNPSDIVKSVYKRHIAAASEPQEVAEERKKAILLVEDSITTRTQERRILEAGGYEVVTAVDGLDAMSKIATRQFDAIVSDIMMPNMNGLVFTEKIRQDKRYKEIPVVLVTTLASDDDKKRGLEAGANAYIPKPAFDQKIFLDTLRRLV
ncbi:MAG: hypothetical protein A3J24_09330 [Deltaproteobacteria bacterium RIFCSPLOWO2_02_FULL_53_8]|nr:MAG: hypothetical protein A3J24_09330 [Deltaproteobacteria bacterium RIFCSPLOWO2_02_FULL_53_8]